MLYRMMAIAVILFVPVMSATAGTVLFEEDFDDGVHDMWTWGKSGMTVDIRNGGVPSSGKFLYTDDHANYGTYVTTKVGFDYVGREIVFSGHVQSGNAPASQERGGLYVTQAPSSRSTMIAVTVRGDTANSGPNAVVFDLLYETGPGSYAWESTGNIFIPGHNGNNFNFVEVKIHPDLYVDFYMNGALIHSSTNPLTDDFDGTAGLMVGSRKSNFDNLKVEDFGTGAAAVPGPLAGIMGLGLGLVGLVRRKSIPG